MIRTHTRGQDDKVMKVTICWFPLSVGDSVVLEMLSKFDVNINITTQHKTYITI